MALTIDLSLPASIPGITKPADRAGGLVPRIGVDQLLEGRVLAVRGRQALISLWGEQIVAESLLPLQVGQVLRLVVREVRPDRITLQVAPDYETGGGAPDLHGVTERDVSELLATQRVPTDRTALLIARTLLRSSLPITGALVLAARNALSFIETPSQHDADAAIFLALRSLPVTPESLEVAKGALVQQNNLGAQMQALATQLRNLLARTQTGDAPAPLPPPLLAVLQETLHGLPRLVPDQPLTPAFPALVLGVLDRIATPTEHRLALFLGEAAPVPQGLETQAPVAEDPLRAGLPNLASARRPDVISPNPSAGQEKATRALTGLPTEEDFPSAAAPLAARRPFPEEWAVIGPRGPERAAQAASDQESVGPGSQRDAASSLSERLHPQYGREDLPGLTPRHRGELARDFRQQLARLNAELALAGAELPRHHPVAPLLHQLQVTVHEMISMVEAEQLTNAGLPQLNQAQGCYVFHLPVAGPDQDTTDTAEVRVFYRREDPNKRVDPESASLAFLLEMSRLGPVEVHVDLYQKHLRCRIECSNGDATEPLRKSSPELKARLQAAGYIVDAIRTTLARPTGTPSKDGSMPSLFQIDLRA